ncbi:methylated-DNA--[protein]-cysteine S-methyltransferase [bacterium]|nr:methylated-DNA--[protein]-cysteine S-methyltransferase [bacterium]
MTIYFDFFYSSAGKILTVCENDYITRIILPRKSPEKSLLILNAEFPESTLKKDPVPFKNIFSQFEEYFSGTRITFNLPLFVRGTIFQKKVWDAIKAVPYGRTASYKELAVKIQNKNASRAVGNACNANPLPIVVPCHRIITSSGKIGGFGGGTTMKRQLLKIEGVSIPL